MTQPVNVLRQPKTYENQEARKVQPDPTPEVEVEVTYKCNTCDLDWYRHIVLVEQRLGVYDPNKVDLIDCITLLRQDLSEFVG